MDIIFRVDASLQIGSGHVMRCLTLAKQLRNRGSFCRFVCRVLEGNMIDHIIREGFEVNLIPVPPDNLLDQSGATMSKFCWKTDVKYTCKLIAPRVIDLIVVDHYEIDFRWESAARTQCRLIMVIDDLADRQHDCDLILDQNYSLDVERYDSLLNQNCTKLIGPKYGLIRSEFKVIRSKYDCLRNGYVRQIMIFFGGSDHTGETEKALQGLLDLKVEDLSIVVIIGAMNPRYESVAKICDRYPQTECFQNVSNMAAFVVSADLAIGAGGSASLERCLLGLPTITVVSAENQLLPTKNLEEQGAIEYLGIAGAVDSSDYRDAVERLLNDPMRIRKMSVSALHAMRDWSINAVVDAVNFETSRRGIVNR